MNRIVKNWKNWRECSRKIQLQEVARDCAKYTLLATSLTGHEDLTSTIEALNMKPEDVTPQQKARIELIHNILMGKDPELRAQLVSLMSEGGWTPIGDQMESVSIYQANLNYHNALPNIGL